MKGQTIEQKARLYDETIEKLRDFYRDYDTISHLIDVKEELANLFPELKESEDERVRKRLIELFHDTVSNDEIFSDYGLDKIEVLAWLEKQGKQPTDKIKPKFKPGDWVVFIASESIYQVEKIENYEYTLRHILGGSLRLSFSNEELIREWTIADAKDGDVLYSLDSKQPFIYKERPQFSQARGHCCINKFGEFAIWNTSKCVICTDKYSPATKEQRDTLMKKMANAGYTFDFEKKELKNIEPKALDPDKVIEWLKTHGNLWPLVTIEINKVINKFKKDFEL